jgi:hypothetical protein
LILSNSAAVTSPKKAPASALLRTAGISAVFALMALSSPSPLYAEPTTFLRAPTCARGASIAARNAKLADFETTLSARIDRVGLANLDFKTRRLVGLFLAWRLPDEPGLNALEQTCWTDFYGAKKLLGERKLKDANFEAERWQVCLRALDPGGAEVAEPTMSCFALPRSTTRGPQQRTPEAKDSQMNSGSIDGIKAIGNQ